jgi:XisH protein
MIASITGEAAAASDGGPRGFAPLAARETAGLGATWYRPQVDPSREMFLAVPEEASRAIFTEALGQLVLRARTVRLLVVDPEKEVITQWIPSTPGETPSNAS